MAQDYEIIDNKERQQFQAKLPDDYAFMEYRWHKGDLALMHTVVPEKYEGQGIASALAKHVLEYAKNNNFKILVYCPYISAYLNRHPEYKTLVHRLS